MKPALFLLPLTLMVSNTFATEIQNQNNELTVSTAQEFMRMTSQDLFNAYDVTNMGDFIYTTTDTSDAVPIYHNITGEYSIVLQAYDEKGVESHKTVTLIYGQPEVTEEQAELELLNSAYAASDIAATHQVFSIKSKFCDTFGIKECSNYTHVSAEESQLGQVFSAINNQSYNEVFDVDVTLLDNNGETLYTTIHTVVVSQ